MLITLTQILMGIFNYGNAKNKNGKFVSEGELRGNRKMQVKMTGSVLEQLRNMHIGPADELKLEYFFYTNTADKAKQMAIEIGKLGYTVQHGKVEDPKDLFIVTGWTNELIMSNQVVEQWVRYMCEFGYKYDCQFDGWGTSPNQID